MSAFWQKLFAESFLPKVFSERFLIKACDRSCRTKTLNEAAQQSVEM